MSGACEAMTQPPARGEHHLPVRLPIGGSEMCRCVLPVVGLIGLLVFAAVAVPALRGREDQGAVYSVAALRARLARDAAAWAGTIVRIRAIAEPCTAWGSPHSPLHC